jgi:putative transposase
MSQSLSKIWTHLVFSTKERYPFLVDPTVRKDMHSYLATTLKANNCPTLLVGGFSDHVHALFVLSKNHSLQVLFGQSSGHRLSGLKDKAKS